MKIPILISLLALVSGGHGSVVVGRKTVINYNSQCGVWNDLTKMKGKILDACCPVDATYPGRAWQQLSLHYINNGASSHFSGNSDSGCSGPQGYTVISEEILNDGSGLVGIEHVMEMGLLQVTKREEWNYDEQEVLITFKVKYTKPKYMTNCREIYNLTLMHAVDPDQDFEPFMTFQTLNDVIFNGGSGLFAEAVGPRSCLSMGYGICSNRGMSDGSSDAVGFTQWVPTTPANLRDPNGELRDDTVHYQHVETRPMFCGEEREFRFFAVWGKCFNDARQNFLAAHGRYCLPCIKRPFPFMVTPPYPRCEGRCPCSKQKGDCTCSYMCPTCVAPTDADRATAIAEADSMLRKCSGLSVTPSPSHFNVEPLTLSHGDCDHVAKEKDILESPTTVVTGYYCDPTSPPTGTMGTYYEDPTTTSPTPSMRTYYYYGKKRRRRAAEGAAAKLQALFGRLNGKPLDHESKQD